MNKTEEQLIKSALGLEWCNLSPKTQARFKAYPDADIEYTGLMSEIHCSLAGKIFANIARIFGSPLVPYSGHDIPIHVVVYKKPGKSDIFKKRTYYFPEKPPFSVETYMHLNAHGEFVEYASLGLGMIMKLNARDGNLYFYGKQYVLDIGRLRIRIPAWLTPGIATVLHTDYGSEQFRVRIEMKHQWLGVTFVQDGIFKSKEKI